MKKTLFIPALFACLLLSNCRCGSQNAGDHNDTLQIDSMRIAETPDSTLWGRMGDGSSMNVLEFITEKGDTLYLAKTSEQTQLEADMIGGLRNFTDRYAITTRGAQVDEGLSIQTCINVSQMMGTWKNEQVKLSLFADGTADNGAANYTSWKVMNGKLVLSGKTNTEYGETDRIDTMTIVRLDDDSLFLTTPQHESLAFGR